MAFKKIALIGALLTASLLGYRGCSHESNPQTLPVEQKIYRQIADINAEEQRKDYIQERSIRDERENKISRLIESHQRHIKRAVDYFNQGISDARYELSEQRATLNEFYEAKKDLESIARMDTNQRHLGWYECSKTQDITITKVKDQKLELTRSQDALYSKTAKNLESFDVGTPELEKSLRKQGLEVSVERTMKPEILIPAEILGLWGIVCFGALLMASPILGAYAELKRC